MRRPCERDMRPVPVIAPFFALALLGGTSAAGQSTGAMANHQDNMSPAPLARTAPDAQWLWFRLQNGLSPELYRNFDLFIYVNKAERGPWAQHLYAFAKASSTNPDADMILMLDTVVSTGRETMERAKNGQLVSTSTPTGFYELDP